MNLSRAMLATAIALWVVPPAFCQKAPAKKLLGSAEIRQSLTGKLISYSPPGWADAGAHEEFHKDGKWRGVLYGRGPIPFTGRWSIEANQLCVVADKGTWAEKQHSGKYCREVWKDMRTGKLLMAHIGGFDDLQTLSVQDLKRLGME